MGLILSKNVKPWHSRVVSLLDPVADDRAVLNVQVKPWQRPLESSAPGTMTPAGHFEPGPRSPLQRSRTPGSDPGPGAAGTPLGRPAHERRAQSRVLCAIQIEVVAGDHQDLRRRQYHPARGRGVRLGVRLVDADHFARDDGIPGKGIPGKGIPDERLRHARKSVF